MRHHAVGAFPVHRQSAATALAAWLRRALRLSLAVLLALAAGLAAARGEAPLPAGIAPRASMRPSQADTARASLHRLLDDEWEWQKKEFPEFATMVGDHRYDDRLTDRSATAVAQRRAHHARVLEALERIDHRVLEGEDRISFAVAQEQAWLDRRADTLLMAHAAQQDPFSANDLPLDISQMAGPQFDLLELPRIMLFDTTDDYRRYAARLHAVPRLLAQLRERLEAGRRSGWMPPRAAVERLPAQFAGLLHSDLPSHVLMAPYAHLPDSIDTATAAALREQVQTLLRSELVPAVTAFRDYLAQTWVPACPAVSGAAQPPAGADWYALQLRRFNTTSLTPQEIHQLGLKEVARIQLELAQVLKDADFHGSVGDFRRWLLTDPRFQFANAEEELDAFRALAKRVDPQLPGLFAELPRLPYGVRPMHAEEGDNPPHYTPGAADGSRAGWFEANTNNLKGQPRWTIESLLLHESVPGHHLQIARAQELQGLPELRRNIEIAAFSEGWALYSESLGYRLGLYRDPYTHFGRLADESLRAARLVVDTGLHAMGWTRQQAIDYMIDVGQQERGYAEAEVDRYLVWAGQATAYKLGELRILALRSEAQAALGERFDLRRFHNAVIDHGALPLSVLDQVVRDWIAAERVRVAQAPATQDTTAGGSAALRSVLDAEWEWRQREFPELASESGDHRYDDQVADLSVAAAAARRSHHSAFLAALQAIDPAQLQGEDAISWKIFTQRARFKVRVDRLLMSTATQPDSPWSADDLPLSLDQMNGPQFDLPQLTQATRFADAADYRHYLQRMDRLPRWFAQYRARLEAARAAGWMPPKVAVTRLPAQFRPLLADTLAGNPLFAPFDQLPQQLPEATRAALRADAQDSQRRLVAAVQEFHDWLQTRWLPAARASTAALDLPRGADYYAAMLEQGSSTTLSPQQIHRIGLGEVARIDAEMAKVRSDSGFHGSSAEFRDWLRSDPRFRFADADAELAAFQALAKRVDPLLPQLFAELPRLPYGVRPMPAAEGSNAPHYVRGAVDGSRAGWFEANLNNLAAWPSWTMDALFLHEAVPGHHLQISRAQELEQLPMLRRTFSNTAYVEGWGLYAEGLGSALGLYADPYARYGRLTLEAHRACRLVLDTGLHALGWTREQAIDYLVVHASLERAFAEAEIDRYLVWPGQATGYKMGELRILANRDKARQALGERFDLRHFHDAVLDHGVLPLSVLDQVIDDWIADQRRAH